MTVLRSGSATDVGRVRPINQDMPLERPNLYAVADGMGGHVGGEVASRVAVETLERAFDHDPTVVGLRDAFLEANSAVWHESQVNADLRGMGTTLTAVALVEGDDGRDVLALANVGDSRAYVYTEGHLVQVTADHSLAEERMRHGEITEAEAAVHPQRHILTRALGVSSDVQADMWELKLRSGDRVLLCSDGLSNEVGMGEMADILGDVSDPQEAAGRLVDAANEHGGADNITVIVVDVQVGEQGPDAASTVSPIEASAAAITVAGATAAATEAAAAAATEAAATTEAAAATPAAAPTTNGDSPSAAPKPDGDGGGGDAPTSTPEPPSDSTRVVASSRTAPVSAYSDSETLPPGARLDFGTEAKTLGEERPQSDEFFVGSGAVPVARTSTRVPLSEQSVASRRDANTFRRRQEAETRREHRHRLGVRRLVTFRALGFILLVAAVPIAAYFVIRWYAYDNYIVRLQGNNVVIQQGQPGGVLWFHPRVVDRPHVTKSDLSPEAVLALAGGLSRSSLKDARDYIYSVTTTTTTTTTSTTAPGTPSSSNSANGSATTTTTTATTVP